MRCEADTRSDPVEPVQDLDQKFKIDRLFQNPDEVEESLLEKIKSVRKSCGQVCDTTIRGRPGKVNPFFVVLALPLVRTRWVR